MSKFRLFHVLTALAVLLTVLILFHLSPFAEVKYEIECHSFDGLIENPAGAQPEPLCGQLLKNFSQIYFPFKENPKTAFCLNNLEAVEESCSIKIDGVLLKDLDQFYYCEYVIYDSDNRLKDIITISHFPREYTKGPERIETSEWHSIKSDLDYDLCKNLETDIKTQ